LHGGGNGLPWLEQLNLCAGDYGVFRVDNFDFDFGDFDFGGTDGQKNGQQKKYTSE
jgi:hypothetical protein